MSGNSAEVMEKAKSQGKVIEFCGHAYLIVTHWQYAGNKSSILT